MGTTYEVNGVSLHVQEYGRVDSPPLLYLHGGPGTGTHDFVYHQAERLSKKLRVIVLDQRGVPQSAPLNDDQTCTMDDLIADCEAMRKLLGIERWSVLGHSFGGYLGLYYAYQYPTSIISLLFENATFDWGLTTRWTLHGAAMEYGVDGNTEKAKQCFDMLYSNLDLRGLDERGWELIEGLGARRNNLYVHQLDKDFFTNPPAGYGVPDTHWEQALVHQRKVFQDPMISESLLPYRLSINIPTLLLKGKYDWVMGNDQISAYMKSNPLSEFVVFENSAHFPHFEEADRFSEIVTTFSLRASAQARPTTH